LTSYQFGYMISPSTNTGMAVMGNARTFGPQDWIVPAALNGEVIVQIGQIAPETEKALNKLVRAGEISKWRGKWYSVAGASYGLGPDKTCWGLTSKFASEAA
jgi:hypothetical protein